MPDPCWCGLPEEHHDGREMDRDGNMHRFGRRVKERWREQVSEPIDEAAPSAPQPALVRADAELLLELKRFLDARIVQPSQNGVKKLPLLVINEATRLSIALSKRIDRLCPAREP